MIRELKLKQKSKSTIHAIFFLLSSFHLIMYIDGTSNIEKAYD